MLVTVATEENESCSESSWLLSSMAWILSAQFGY